MTPTRRAAVYGLGALVVLLRFAGGAHAQTAANVAVVINEASEASIQIGEYYAQKRGVPESNIIRILTPLEESITRAAYTLAVERPLERALMSRGLEDRILYIVLTKGVPLKISGRALADAASVDSELTLLYRRMSGREVLITGAADNPYYAATRPIGEARSFNRRDHDIYLVTRLDGFTVQDALALVDRGVAPTSEGRILLDRRAGPTGMVDRWLMDAAARLRQLGHERVEVVESLPEDGAAPVLGYFSWGSNDPPNRRRRLGLPFTPGAIAATLAGSDARTFAAPPETWQPGGGAGDRASIFAQGPHSLTADLIRDGVTGVAGNVSEPLLGSAIRPQILFPAYRTGFNLAESFYLALPHLSWQTVIIGDPLCRPFGGPKLTEADIESPREPVTGLPGYFATRRIEVLHERNAAAPREAIALVVRAEEELRSGNRAAARLALEQATEQAPGLHDEHLQLAALYEEAGDIEAAVRRYRRVLELQPRNAAALNNLAYRIAVDLKSPSEALPLARRAAALFPHDPRILDTFGWIHHLLGNSAEAVRLLTEAARRAPRSAPVRLHAALALAAVGSYTAADEHLKEALRLSPVLETGQEVRDLQATLAKRR